MGKKIWIDIILLLCSSTCHHLSSNIMSILVGIFTEEEEDEKELINKNKTKQILAVNNEYIYIYVLYNGGECGC